MEHRFADRKVSALAAMAALAFVATAVLGPTTAPAVEHRTGAPGFPFLHDATQPAYVDPVLRRSLMPGAVEPAIVVIDPYAWAAAWHELGRLGLERNAYDELHMASVLLPAALLETVAAIPGVVSVYGNEKMHLMLDQSADYVGAKAVWNTYRVTGRGVSILIMDSGVDGTHPDTKYRVNLLENVVPTRQTSGLIGGSREGVVSSDPDGHGTHVAAIAGGTGRASDGKHRGIAYQAKLVGYQAGLPDPKTGDIEFESLTVLEGFNWALANHKKYGIQVVSNSWGANGDFDPRSPVNIATFNLYKSGMVVVFAAGNEGSHGAGSLNKYSVAPWVLGVTAGDYLNHVPSFASRGSDPAKTGLRYDHPDLVAPGVSITSARAQKEGRPASTESQLYGTKSGTSMATPHVAGIAALLLEANPRLSPDDVMDILTATATPLPRSPVWEGGAGYVNALKAYQLAARAVGHRDEFLGGKVKYAGPASGDNDYARDAVTVGYLRGEASRLRSPDKSIATFLAELVTTPLGLVFLLGGLGLAILAFGVGHRPAPRALDDATTRAPLRAAASPPPMAPLAPPAIEAHVSASSRVVTNAPDHRPVPAASPLRVLGAQARGRTTRGDDLSASARPRSARVPGMRPAKSSIRPPRIRRP
jgi:serine protease AprX